jgi:hypothetical protein
VTCVPCQPCRYCLSPSGTSPVASLTAERMHVLCIVTVCRDRPASHVDSGQVIFDVELLAFCSSVLVYANMPDQSLYFSC